MAKKKESIKYCARKCHNGGPLTKMMANHRKKFCGGAERTIAILSSSWRGQPDSQPPPLLPPPQPAPGQPSLPSLPQSATKPERLPPLSPARIYVKHFINLGAHIMSPTILKLLLTAMTLVSVASEEGKNIDAFIFKPPLRFGLVKAHPICEIIQRNDARMVQ